MPSGSDLPMRRRPAAACFTNTAPSAGARCHAQHRLHQRRMAVGRRLLPPRRPRRQRQRRLPTPPRSDARHIFTAPTPTATGWMTARRLPWALPLNPDTDGDSLVDGPIPTRSPPPRWPTRTATHPRRLRSGASAAQRGQLLLADVTTNGFLLATEIAAGLDPNRIHTAVHPFGSPPPAALHPVLR